MSMPELDRCKREYMRYLGNLAEAEDELLDAEERVKGLKWGLEYLDKRIKELEHDFNELS